MRRHRLGVFLYVLEVGQFDRSGLETYSQACWSADGSHIYAGRRNGTVDVWDVRLLGRSGPRCTPRLVKSLRNPPSSGVVSCVVPFPDGRHIAWWVCGRVAGRDVKMTSQLCSASIDNIRLWNAAEAGESDGNVKGRGGVQFKIIPGHHGGYVSQMGMWQANQRGPGRLTWAIY